MMTEEERKWDYIEKTNEELACEKCGGLGKIDRYYYKGEEVGYDYFCDNCGNYEHFEHPYIRAVID